MAGNKSITSTKKQVTNKIKTSEKVNTYQKQNIVITLKLQLKDKKNLMTAETK
jgi:hypothetical protein